MNIKKKLQNPFALIAEGFIGGAAIFYLAMPANADAPSQAARTEATQFAATAKTSQT